MSNEFKTWYDKTLPYQPIESYMKMVRIGWDAGYKAAKAELNVVSENTPKTLEDYKHKSRKITL